MIAAYANGSMLQLIRVFIFFVDHPIGLRQLLFAAIVSAEFIIFNNSLSIQLNFYRFLNRYAKS